jgi:hypothetical protein
MWSAEAVARKIDYEKRRFDNKRTLNIKDESEFRKGDVAARWLARSQRLRLRNERPLRNVPSP